ncbi:hypothetical protein L6164_013969 [Bauhinia variegata]|uniref:Uncharacterized protein n=1 Tax=Bauhinia variegata TaxID=167791 RepID=A0ACB9NG43_BAUVA|nr:hypothetical protein L6164_013969 [Bauhinia variegata]
MDWWYKIRTAWAALSSRLKLAKSGGGGRGRLGGGRRDCGGDSGLLKLRDDVQMCGYRDVEVMWNMLSRARAEEMRGATTTRSTVTPPKNLRKQRSIWRIFFWTNHNP